MANKKSTILTIEADDQTEAQFMSRNFVDKEIKNRVYLNALGAELVSKYLKSQGVDTSNTHNLHSISKIIEMVDISDILLPNIHIDVRVVFDENEIFIPISHFELGITPDIYVVLKLDKNDLSHLDLVGYFSPDVVDENNKNDKYYFVEREKVTPADALAVFVKNHSGSTSKKLSEKDLLSGRTLSISLADHDIDQSEVKKLLNLLLSSDDLRESVLEFDNFETLSYNVAPTIQDNSAPQVQPIDEELIEEDASEEEETLHQEEEVLTPVEDLEEVSEEIEEPKEVEKVEEVIDESLTEEVPIEEIEPISKNVSLEDEDVKLVADEDIKLEQEDVLLPELDLKVDELEPVSELKPDKDENKKDSNAAKIIGESLGIAGAVASAGAVGAAGAAAAEGLAAGAVSEGAINLASIAGDIVNDLKNISSTSHESNLKDISNMDSTFESSKTDEKSQDEFHAPKDLSDFEQVDSHKVEEDIEHEAVDFGDMEPVKDLQGEIEENPDNLTSLPESDKLEKEESVAKVEEISDEVDTDDSEELVGQALENLNVEEDEHIELIPEDEHEVDFDGNEEVIEISNDTQIEETSDEKPVADDIFENEPEIVEDVVDEFAKSPADDVEDDIIIQEEIVEPTKDSTDPGVQNESYEDDLFDIQDFINAQEEENKSVSKDVEVNNSANVDEEKVIENSAIISDKNFNPGEIEIDINKQQEQNLEGSEHLENLYNTKSQTVPGAAFLNSPSQLNRQSKGRGLGLLGIIISLIILGVVGFSISKMMKKPVTDAPQPITDHTEDVPDSSSGLNVNEGNVVNMDKVSPISPAAVQHKNAEKPQVAAKSSKSLSPTQFISVRKLSWEVPSHVSSNKNFMQYFQSSGKSLKLSLTSDLLLATDYVYSDQVRVSVNYAQDGSFRDAKILLSSGSPQVDKIVLQTVNQTLKVLKAPHSVGNDSATTVILKIYF